MCFYTNIIVLASLIVSACTLLGCRSCDGPSRANHRQAGKQSVQSSSVVLVEIRTSMGPIRLELWPDKAPQTVANFLRYVDDGFYDGTVFHRVIDGFMIQGGGMTAQLQPKQTYPPIPNEADENRKNLRGTIAMARTPQVDSATSQFFINVVDNPFLDHKDDTTRGFGYCVFGRVVEGMETVDRISKVPTTTRSGYQDVPVEPVVIESVRRIAGR